MADYQVKQGSAAYPLLFLLVSSTDHIAGVTGLSPAVTLSKAGGAFAAPAGAVAEIGSGWYRIAGNAADSDTLGPLVLHATAPGADPTDAVYQVVAYDPQSAAGLGLANLDAAVSTRSTYAGGAVASVTAPVTAGNLPTDYQQRGVAVTLPDPAPAGYGGASAGQLAAAVLATPANLLATDATGRVTAGSVADKAGYALAADGVDLVTIETGINLRQASSLILAGQGGVLSGAGTTTITIKGGNVTETRVAATVDTAGNRNSVTLTPPA